MALIIPATIIALLFTLWDMHRYEHLKDCRMAEQRMRELRRNLLGMK